MTATHPRTSSPWRVTTTLALLLCATTMHAQTPTLPQTDTSTITPDGAAHVTRVVPVPTTVSPEAQHSLAHVWPDDPTPESLADQRRSVDTWQAGAGAAFRKLYPVDVQPAILAGVPVRLVTPPSIPENHRDRVLINLHGGGFRVDSGSLTESIPMAALTQTKTIAVLYRLAPEHPFPAAVDDAVAVYRDQLKTHRPENIAIYGTSAGAILTAEVAVRLKQLNLPLPSALGVFSGMGDYSRPGDSIALFGLRGLAGHLDTPDPHAPKPDAYTGTTPLTDPVLSPVFADLHGLPPTLFITSTRDLLLSGTTILHRAFLHAGVDAHLVVFEALPHAFWNDPNLPETKEAHDLMARFFNDHLGHTLAP